MKYLRILAVTIIALFAFEGAKAQVVVKARVGAPVERRTVITTRPAYHREVISSRRVYRRPYRRVVVTRPAYRRTVVYHRPHRRTVVVRRY